MEWRQWESIARPHNSCRSSSAVSWASAEQRQVDLWKVAEMVERYLRFARGFVELSRMPMMKAD